MMDTTDKVIKCKAAVAWERNKPLTIEEIEVDPPKEHEVRIKVVSCAICRTDISKLDGHFGEAHFPTIMGHEASGIVESIGPNVTSVVKGDHVLPCFLPQCNDCRICFNPNANTCEKRKFGGTMSDGTTRIHCKGKDLNHCVGCSTFAEYAVIADTRLVKISDSAPLEKVCLISCGFGTGYGAATKIAKVTPGSSCAVWGMGAIGLAAINGCQNSGAKRIIAVDVNNSKAEIAKKMGATDFLNPNDSNAPFAEVLREMTDGGLDYAFECVGNAATIKEAYDSCHISAGTCVIVGVPPNCHIMEINTMDLLFGKKLTGTLYGGFKPLSDIPNLVNDYLDKKIMLDELITEEISLERINDGIQSMNDGKVVRVIVNIGNK